MIKNSTWFELLLNANGIPLLRNQVEQLELYVSLLLEWNQKVNLISRKSEETIWEEQILHSISFLFKNNLHFSTSVIDVGTGGGLPGIPLKIIRPDLSITLLDSISKKIDALNNILSKLNLSNIEALCSRAEDLYKKKDFSKRYDYVIFRGVGPLLDLWKYGATLLRHVNNNNMRELITIKPGFEVHNIPTNSILALKGGNIDDELSLFRKKKPDILITKLDIVFRGDADIANREKKIIILQKKV